MASLRLSTMFSQIIRQRASVSSCFARKTSPVFGQGVRFMSNAQTQFEQAKEKLGSLKEDPGNDAKLKMYALFKQATNGAATGERPGMMNFVARAKWDAWNDLGNMEQDEAKKQYAMLVDELAAEEESTAEASESSLGTNFSCLSVSQEGNLRTITLNRPKKFNAITNQMYEEWMIALKEAAEDPKTTVTAITGAGEFFCAGNDLSNFANIPESGPEAFAKDCGELLYRFVDSFIDFPKPLVGVVNGPAFGISVTTMALYDVIYASDKAWFTTPFTKLGQSAEGCSSFTFPRIMGPGIASEMLIFNKKMTASEAQKVGLVTEVIPEASFQETVWPRLQEYADLPPKSLIYGKELYRASHKQTLKEVNRRECDRLVERWLSEECRNAVIAFLSRKK